VFPLVEDIRKNGLRSPIVLDGEGKVLLDGRRCRLACQRAGVEPRFVAWEGEGSPLEMVISLNVQRRHMNESQRAMAAARLAPQLPAVEKGSAACLNLGRQGRAARAAAMLNVSRALVEHARRVLASGEAELIRQVESGQLKVSTAARQLRPPRPETAEAPADAGENAVLLLWGPAATLAEKLPVFDRWGFQYRQCRWAQVVERR
jgi:hypothetical protein